MANHIEDDDDSMGSYPEIDDEGDMETSFWGANVKVGSDSNVELNLGEELEVKSVALSGSKQEVVVSAEINGEKFVFATLSAAHPQYRLDLLFGITESPVKFSVSGKGEGQVTFVGVMRTIIDSEDDFDMDEEELAARSAAMGADFGDEEDEDEEDEEESPVKPQKAQMPAKQEKKAPAAAPQIKADQKQGQNQPKQGGQQNQQGKQGGQQNQQQGKGQQNQQGKQGGQNQQQGKQGGNQQQGNKGQQTPGKQGGQQNNKTPNNQNAKRPASTPTTPENQQPQKKAKGNQK
eukprot:TRINITY_DN402_c0_g1_i1.p1 TRINITY_DN402_c0_g1~~TRINITY_DN402_c0_g1_i1.p1  ORF type:complete len:291 (+),score=104.12 TRINITY_DN402_c0_g1_i1:175-1047(+)